MVFLQDVEATAHHKKQETLDLQYEELKATKRAAMDA